MCFHTLGCTVAATALAALASAGEIRGRVLVDGKPAAGVVVAVLPFEDGFAEARREARREDVPKALAVAPTRPDGTFAVLVPASAGTGVQLAFSGGASAPRRLEALLDAGGDDAGDVRLSKAAALAGRVVDERGSPVVGATVTLWAGGGGSLRELSPARGVPQSATTKADGTFRLDAAAAESNRLRVEAPAFATLERQPVRAGALARPLVLALGQVLRGSVTLADRRTPAKGALVRFEGRTQTTRWIETRPDGSFLLDGAPREPGALVADGGERGRASAALAAGASEPVTIVLAPTATLAGRVVEADGGRPLAGIRLAVRGEGAVFLARSGPDGRYSFRGLAPRRYRLSAEDDRFVPWVRSVGVASGQAEMQDVPLARAATLAGRVLSEEGAPIEGARVRVARSGENVFRAFMRSLDEEQAVSTGRDGTFRATRLAPGDNQRLDVRHDDYEQRAIGGLSLAPGSTRSGLTVVLRRGLSLRGVVKDEEGRALAGCEVTLSAARQLRAGRGGLQMQLIGPGNQVRRETGPDGRFEFRGLQPGEYSLVARRPGFARAVLDPVNVAEARAGELVELTLRPGSTISGVLRDRGGNGASGWFVSARASGQSGPPLGPAGLRSEEPTGPDGVFLLEGLAAGESYELSVMGQAGLGPRRSGVIAPAEGIELVVNGTGQVRGRVTDADSGRAVTDFQVRYQPDAQGGMRFVMRAGPGGGRGPFERQSFHAEDGAFALEDVPAGRWTIEAFAPGYQPGSASAVTVAEGDTTEGVEVRLSKGGVVSGRVLESRSGRPILDATLRAEQSGGEPRMGMLRIGGEGGDNEASSDAEGRYELSGLAPGTWTITASHPDWSEAVTSVEIKDAPATADIRLGRGGSVGGSVLAGGRPVGGAQVTLQAAGDSGMRPGVGFLGGGEQSALSDGGGRFRFDRLAPGRYQLSAALRDQTSAPAEAVLTGDDIQEVQLTLAEGALVRGVVTGLPEAQLTGVNLSAQGPDYFASTRTSSGGSFELSGVPEGTITLRANAGDFMTSSRSAQATLTIAPGQAEATAEIRFEQGFRVDGHVTRGGRPLADAMVMAFPDGGGRRSASARTDEAGGYVIEGLDEGRYTFSANSEAGAPIRRTVDLSGDTTVDLEAPPFRLAGTVVEAESGRALGDVSIRIEDDGGVGMRFVNMAATDSSGRFAFEDMEPRHYRVTFQKPAYQVETRELTAAEESDLRVELRRGEGIALEARDGIFATPLRGLFVRVADGSGTAVFMGSVSLDSGGRGEVPSLKPGTYELRAESSGYAPISLPGVAVPSRTLSLLLTPGGSLEIQAGPTTLALPQASGRLIGESGRIYMWNAFTADGKIRLTGPVRRLENVAPGRYTLEVEGGVRRDVTIAEGSRAVVSLP